LLAMAWIPFLSAAVPLSALTFCRWTESSMGGEIAL